MNGASQSTFTPEPAAVTEKAKQHQLRGGASRHGARSR